MRRVVVDFTFCSLIQLVFEKIYRNIISLRFRKYKKLSFMIRLCNILHLDFDGVCVWRQSLIIIGVDICKEKTLILYESWMLKCRLKKVVELAATVGRDVWAFLK